MNQNSVLLLCVLEACLMVATVCAGQGHEHQQNQPHQDSFFEKQDIG